MGEQIKNDSFMYGFITAYDLLDPWQEMEMDSAHLTLLPEYWEGIKAGKAEIKAEKLQKLLNKGTRYD